MAILIVAESPDPATHMSGRVLSKGAARLLGDTLKAVGIPTACVKLTHLCAPIPEEWTEGRKKDAYLAETPRIRALIEELQPDCVVALGAGAATAVNGHPTSLKDQRAKLQMVTTDVKPFRLFATYAPSYVLSYPQRMPVWSADWATLAKIQADGWQVIVPKTNYRWARDVDFLHSLTGTPLIGVDTETWNRAGRGELDDGKVEVEYDRNEEATVYVIDRNALRWDDPATVPLTIQFAWAPGESVAVPVDREYYAKVFGTYEGFEETRESAYRVIRNPNIKKVGHNFKYDWHVIKNDGEIVRGWVGDTLQLAHSLDENMLSKSQDECVRVWLPSYAGYSDAFDATVDKSRMQDVPPDVMLPYAAGDSDTVRQLYTIMAKRLYEDRQAWNVYRRITMPGHHAFARMEDLGTFCDLEYLRSYGAKVASDNDRLFGELVAAAPGKVKYKQIVEFQRKKREASKSGAAALAADPFDLDIKQDIDWAKLFSFARTSWVIDLFFGQDGFGLTPVKFAEKTGLPSISAKTHLPYFASDPRCGSYVVKHKLHIQMTKLIQTYTGKAIKEEVIEDGKPVTKFKVDEGHPTGLWKYLQHDFIPYVSKRGIIKPTFYLSVTDTGRTASRSPNGQNFPTRPPFGEDFQDIFVKPPDGWIPGSDMIDRLGRRWVCIPADLSQIELRLVAWESGDKKMMEVYHTPGGDIHSTTAKSILRIPDAVWKEMSKKERKDPRQKAKSANFGLIYDMFYKSYRDFAFTQYGVILSDAEAKAFSDLFFDTYSGLKPWHDRRRQEVREYGFVRSLHGAVRHLPQIWSSEQHLRKEAERQAINSPIQRLGSDIGVSAAARLQAQEHIREWFRLHLFIHDALYAYVREDKVREGVQYLVYAMESMPWQKWFGLTPPLPILSDPDIGLSLSPKRKVELKAMKDADELPEWAKPLILGNGLIEDFTRLDHESWTYEARKPVDWDDRVDDMSCELFA